MPRFLQVCAESGCPQLVSHGRCPKHAREYDHQIRERSSWRWVYADPRWRSLRRQVREEQLLCVGYAGEVCREVWRELDHIVALQDGGQPFERTNVQGLCRSHHSTKTADEVNSRR